MIKRHRFHDWVGLSGIASDENTLAKQWAKRLEWPMLFMALWILISWYWSSNTTLPQQQEQLLNWGIWTFFIVETVLLTILVNDKARYLKTNWLNLVIILGGIPVLWGFTPYASTLRILRLLLFISLLLQLSETVRAILSRNNLGPTLMISFFIIMIAGYLIAGMDPNIESPIDGIWWAWVTVTTVGYGDIVPTSLEGRIFASLLILMGIGLFAMLTAAFSAFFISTQSDLHDDEINHFEKISKKLDRIEQRLTELESKISAPEGDNGSEQSEKK